MRVFDEYRLSEEKSHRGSELREEKRATNHHLNKSSIVSLVPVASNVREVLFVNLRQRSVGAEDR